MTLLRVLLLPGQLRGSLGDMGLGKRAPSVVDLLLHFPSPSCVGRIFHSCNGCPICFYPHGFLRFFSPPSLQLADMDLLLVYFPRVPIRDIPSGWGSDAVPGTGCMGWAHLPP